MLVPVRLSQTQQDFLVDHVNGVRPLNNRNHLEIVTRDSMIRHGYVRYEMPMERVGRPKGTRLTERGRDTLCRLLAIYAEALVRAQQAEDDSIEVLLPPAYRRGSDATTAKMENPNGTRTKD